MRIRHAALLALSALASTSALAADYPILRGTHAPELPPPPVIEQAPAFSWDGFYIGGMAGFNSAAFATRDSASKLVEEYWRGTVLDTVNPKYSTYVRANDFSSRGTKFGAFIGYNMAFGEAVFGFEADYMRLGLGGNGAASAPTLIYSAYNDGSGNSIWEQGAAIGSVSGKVRDLFTLRARMGYAMGNFLPYITGGAAFGYGSSATSVTNTGVRYTCSGGALPPACPSTTTSATVSRVRNNAFMSGFTLGGGLEVAYGSLLLRGEYLYSRLGSQGDMTVDINQVRVGAGVKF